MSSVEQNESLAGCSLSADDLQERVHRLREQVVAAATAVETLPEGYSLRFSSDADICELEELVRLQGQCSPSLSFDLHAGTDEVVLEISGPPGAGELIAELLPELEQRSKTLWQRYGRKGLTVALMFFLFCELPLLVAMIGATGLFGLDSNPRLRWGIVIGGLVLGLGFFAVRRLRRRRQMEGDLC